MYLVIDTSTRHGAVGIWRDGTLARTLAWRSRHNHTAELMPAVDEVLKGIGAAPKELTGIVVAHGPGGFSALRVGLGAAKGLAFAVGAPLVGISTLEASAYPYRGVGLPVCSIIESGRDLMAWARFQETAAGWKRRTADRITPSEALLAASVRGCAARALGGVVAANFALGAVMMMHLARVAAPFFEAVEVIEQHHDGKVDAPSGTGMATAEAMREARGSDFRRNVADRETLPNARGAALGGVTLHAVRLPGLVAHQTVLFGGLGETLTIRHDSMNRDSFMPGVLRATRAAMELDHLVVGLDRVLGLRSD